MTRKIEAWAVVQSGARAAHFDHKVSAEQFRNQYRPNGKVVHLTGELPDEPVTMAIGPWRVTGIHRDIEPGEEYVYVGPGGVSGSTAIEIIPAEVGVFGGCRFFADGFKAEWVGE